MADDIRVEVTEHIAIVTLNRPERLNALTPAVMDHLRAEMERVDADPAVRVVVLTGAGRGFSSGGDREFLRQLTGMQPFEIKQSIYANFSAGIKAIKLCSKPTLAAVNGPAVGAGCELAVACDFRIAAESAVFHENWSMLGVIAPLGGMFLLPRIVGLARATEMLMLAKRVDAQEALRIGLVSEVVPDERLAEAAGELASRLAAAAPLALRACKEGLRRGMESSLAAEWEFNVYAQSMLIDSEDFAEAVAAMHEKRAPVFRGR